MKPRRPGRVGKPAARRSPNRLYAAFGLVAGLGLFYGWNAVFLGPKSDEAAEVKVELAAAGKQESELRRQLGQLQKLAAETQAREAEIARLGQLIPATEDVAGAILALHEAANQAQVAWSSFVPSRTGVATAGGPGTLAISMNIGGSFAQIFDYLSRLEALDRLVVVDGVALGGAGQAGQLSADIKARMFSSGGSPQSGATATLAKAGG